MKSMDINKFFMEEGRHILFAVLVLFIVVVFQVIINKLFKRITLWMSKNKPRYFKGIKFRDYEILTSEMHFRTAVKVNTAVKWTIVLVTAYITLPILFSIFEFTKDWADILFHTITDPIRNVSRSVWNYMPNLFMIVVIFYCTRYTIRLTKYFADEVETGKLTITNFHPEWAMPTFNIIKFLLYLLMFIFIFPYLPGSDSPVFQSVSVIMGVLLSFGSSSAVSNMVAGLVITYMRPFNIGDRIQFGEVTGDVIEKTLLVTRIRTIKNVDVTIPNASILSGHTINYSTTPDKPIILHTTVTIGYDVPWREMHETLREAARRTNMILDDPHPFVLQTSLDDFYVSYQINAYTQEPSKQAKIYSDLHKHIQDVCSENNIEIMSPHYRAERDGPVTTPKPYKK